MICQKTMPVNNLGEKKSGVDLNKEYHFRRASGNPVPGQTNAHRQDRVYSTHGLPCVDKLYPVFKPKALLGSHNPLKNDILTRSGGR